MQLSTIEFGKAISVANRVEQRIVTSQLAYKGWKFELQDNYVVITPKNKVHPPVWVPLSNVAFFIPVEKKSATNGQKTNASRTAATPGNNPKGTGKAS